jgi:hypothetical protein
MAFVDLQMDGIFFYPSTINRVKTIFMQREGHDFILHGLFVDDAKHTSTGPRLKEECMKKYSKDFNITCGDLMKSTRSSFILITASKNALRVQGSTRTTSSFASSVSRCIAALLSPDRRTARLFPIRSDRSSAARLWQSFSLQPRGFAWIWHIQYHSLRGSVHLQALPIGRPSITSWSASKGSAA